MAVDAARAKSIFLAASELADPAQRAEYLEQQCGSDGPLRARVEALLRADEAAEGPDGEPSAGEYQATIYAPPSMQPGTLVAGRYRLLEAIGEGGMGTVWLAEQKVPVKRKVAIKLIKAGMDSRQVLARFEAERQALALMDHPNIAKVFDGGMTDQGLPFFVMEYVKGVPLTDYCDQARLSIKERLQLFILVCQAVQHAHQKGIIHRDLKPSNILICLYDGKPVPKVIDFGLAKAMHQSLTEQSLYTAHGIMIGTPLYMSPEQAEHNNLDVDTRTDIYSLGVILYELLTGTTPLERQQMKAAAYNEILRLIKEVEPPKPSTRLSGSNSLPSIAAQRNIDPRQLSKSLSGDLDWIVMKALDKERSRRYEAANGLSRDIERFLCDEAVEACPPSTAYRLQKFVKRNKMQVIAAGLVTLTLIGGIAGTSWGMLRAVQAAAAERFAKDDAIEQKRLAEEAAEQERLAKIREEERAEGERQAKVIAQTNEKVTRAVLEFFQDRIFAAARPKGQAGGLGRDVQMVDAIRAALPFVETSFADQPLVEALLRTSMGHSFYFLGNNREAEKQYGRARDLYLAQYGEDHRLTLASMRELAKCHRGRPEDGLKLQQEILQRQQNLFGLNDPDTIMTMNNLAVSYLSMGRNPEAVELLEEVVRLKTAVFGRDDPSTLSSVSNLASGYSAQGRLSDALNLTEDIRIRVQEKLGPDHPSTLAAMHNLATRFTEAGNFAEAAHLFEETFERKKAILGADHPDTLLTMAGLAAAYQKLGRSQEALPLLEEHWKLAEGNQGRNDLASLRSLGMLAQAYGDIGQRTKALELLEETDKRFRANFPPDHPDSIVTSMSLAIAYNELDRHAEALPLHEEVTGLCRSKFGPDHPLTLTAMENLATTYAYLDRYSDAAQLFEETLKLSQAMLGPEHPSTLVRQGSLAVSFSKLDRHVEAMALFEETLEPMKAKLGEDHPQVIMLIVNIAVLQSRMITTADDPKKQADLAMDGLRQAVDRGYNSLVYLKQEKDLDPLREREDFQQLLAELEAKSPPQEVASPQEPEK